MCNLKFEEVEPVEYCFMPFRMIYDEMDEEDFREIYEEEFEDDFGSDLQEDQVVNVREQPHEDVAIFDEDTVEIISYRDDVCYSPEVLDMEVDNDESSKHPVDYDPIFDEDTVDVNDIPSVHEVCRSPEDSEYPYLLSPNSFALSFQQRQIESSMDMDMI